MAHQSIFHHGDTVKRIKPVKAKADHFLDNEQFKGWIKEYQEKCILAESEGKEIPQMPNNIGTAIRQICEVQGRKPNFIGYSWLDDMIGDAIIKCLSAVRKFDTTLGTSAYSYFTQVCFFEFLNRLTFEKEQKYAKAAIVQNIGLFFDEVAIQEADAGEEFHSAMSEILALNSIEIDYSRRSTKKEKEDNSNPFDIFNVEENVMDKLLEKNNEDSYSE